MNFLHFLFHLPNIILIFFIFSSFPLLWFLNLLFLITSSSNVRFLIRPIPWCTHSSDFLGIALDNQIHHSLLYIFHRIMWGSMRESLHLLWLDYTFIGVLRPVMRLVFWFLCFYSLKFIGRFHLVQELFHDLPGDVVQLVWAFSFRHFIAALPT